jgi:hypothetical protein
MRRRLILAGGALAALLATVQIVAVVVHAAGDDDATGAGLASVPALLRAPEPAERTVDAYAGAGAWVDVYDMGDAAPTPAPVTPATVDAMADAGVRTVYLQAARDEPGRAPGVHDPVLAGQFLVRAHERGLRVVGWYLPRFGDLDRDLDHLRAIAEFEALGHRFDGVAVDIEWTDTVADSTERSARLVELSERLRDVVGDDALGAIVPAPVHLDVVNPGFWPRFPWDELASLYDAWLPMGYWTDRTAASGYRHAATYTTENLRRLRDHVGDEAPVHAIGGLGEGSTPGDVTAFAGVAETEGAVGASIYDWATLPAALQRQLSDALGG